MSAILSYSYASYYDVHSSMTDWKSIAQARGLEPEDRVILPLQNLEAQFSALRAQILLETEPVTHHVLPLPEAQ